MASSSSLAAPPAARQAPSSRIAHRPADGAAAAAGNGHGSMSNGTTSSSRADYVDNGGSGTMSQRQSPAAGGPSEKQPVKSSQGTAKSKQSQSYMDSLNESVRMKQDVREKFPHWMRRWTGWRPPGEKPPHKPLPIPPFTWLAKLPLKYETWILSCVGSFGGIALIEVIIAAAFPNDGTILVVASFGASAVLCYGTIESPLAQPRHLVGGQVLSCILSVAITRLFRKASGYELSNAVIPGELNHVVWINGALNMALSLLLMQITGTVHPPGGATAIIAATTPVAVDMSWRLIYVVLISSVVMLAWALVINNVGRRRYPHYWFSGTRTFVHPPPPPSNNGAGAPPGPSGEKSKLPQKPTFRDEDAAEMAAEEGRAAFYLGPDGRREGRDSANGVAPSNDDLLVRRKN